MRQTPDQGDTQGRPVVVHVDGRSRAGLLGLAMVGGAPSVRGMSREVLRRRTRRWFGPASAGIVYW